MKVVALVSGGKDSCFGILHCIANGLDVVAIANLHPAESDPEELDSQMFQTVGHGLVPALSECMVNPACDDQLQAPPLPIFRRVTKGRAICESLTYTAQNNEHSGGSDEVEDLYQLLADVKKSIPDLWGVSSGAILSNYQRLRVEDVCRRLKLQSLGFLWNSDQKMLLRNMITSGLDAVIVKVAAMGLRKEHVGRTIKELEPHLLEMGDKYGINVCGEGGEFETLTLDAPFFRRSIVLGNFDLKSESQDPIAAASHLYLKTFSTKEKCNVKSYKEVCEAMKKMHIYPEKTTVVLDSLSSAAQVPRSELETPNVVFTKSAAVSLPKRITYSDSKFSVGQIRVPSNFNGTLQDETRAVLSSLQQTLKEEGYSLRNVLFVHVLVRSMKDFGFINAVYEEFFGVAPPARACVEAPLKSCSIQIDAIGACDLSQRKNLHVASISYWAPANIGPYSQFCAADNIAYIAGQIGFIPESMTVPDDLNAQSVLALRHVQRIAENQGLVHNLDYVSCVCYVTSIFNASGIAQKLWRSAAPMLLIELPCLPRNAKIEWMVVAAKVPASDSRESASLKLETKEPLTFNALSLQAEATFFLVKSVCLFVATIKLNSADSNDTVKDLQSALIIFTEHMTKSISGQKKMEPMLMRVYYLETLSAEFENVCAAAFRNLSVSLVPCTGIENNNHVAIVAHYNVS